jgi:hypothetical protein
MLRRRLQFQDFLLQQSHPCGIGVVPVNGFVLPDLLETFF